MMVVKIVHKKTKKDYYVRDVVRLLIMNVGTEFIYRIKRKYQRDGETVTEESGYHGSEYYVGDVYEEEEWMDD